MKTKKVGVVMGGPSTEREVSLNTGNAIIDALKENGYQAIGIDLQPKLILKQLQESGIDVVFNAIHGKYGEDGILQGTLEMLDIPYTGSGVLASAVTMDKSISKRLFAASGIPTPKFEIYNKLQASHLVEEIIEKFGIPVVVKSTAQGSSIGVVIVEKTEDLAYAINEAFKYGDNLVVEEYIKGKEVTAAVLEADPPIALPVIQIVPHSGRYDYQSKYTKGATDYLVPAPLSDQVTKEIQKVAVKVFSMFECRGVARVDIMLDSEDRPYVLEVNTVPGMTATSLVPKAAAAAGISFADLCEKLVLAAHH